MFVLSYTGICVSVFGYISIRMGILLNHTDYTPISILHMVIVVD